MIFKGMKFVKSNNLLSRLSEVGDVYADGTSVPENHCVVVKVSDCKLVDEEGMNRTYSTKNAPCITNMTGHSRTNMFYGKWKKRNAKNGISVFNIDEDDYRLAYTYYQQTVYLIMNDKVYKHSIKRAVSPKQIKIVKK